MAVSCWSRISRPCRSYAQIPVNNPSYPARFCSTFFLGISAKLKFFEREIVVHPVCSLYFTCNWIGIYVDNLVLSTHAVIKKGVRFTHNPSIASHPCSDVPIGSQHPCQLLSVFHDRALTGKRAQSSLLRLRYTPVLVYQEMKALRPVFVKLYCTDITNLKFTHIVTPAGCHQSWRQVEGASAPGRCQPVWLSWFSSTQVRSLRLHVSNQQLVILPSITSKT